MDKIINDLFRWRLPAIHEIGKSELPEVIITYILTLLVAVSAAILVGRYATEKKEDNKAKISVGFAALILIVTLLLLVFFGFSLTTLKGVVLAILLVFSSYEDIKKRECSDYIHLMILITSFIGTELTSIQIMFVSAMFVGGLMLLTVLISNSDIGGADIKISVACAFLLGLSRGVFGLLMGMILALLFNIFKKDKTKGFPLIPYLAAGYMAAFFIQA